VPADYKSRGTGREKKGPPGFIWFLAGLGIGLFVTIFSYVSDSESLIFFIYVGYLFIAIGAIKLVIRIFADGQEGKKQRSQQPQHHNQAYYHQQTQQPAQHNQTTHHQAHNQAHPYQIYYCPRCRFQIKHGDNYCRQCGQRLSM